MSLYHKIDSSIWLDRVLKFQCWSMCLFKTHYLVVEECIWVIHPEILWHVCAKRMSFLLEHGHLPHQRRGFPLQRSFLCKRYRGVEECVHHNQARKNNCGKLLQVISNKRWNQGRKACFKKKKEKKSWSSTFYEWAQQTAL